MPAGARYWISEGMLNERIYNSDTNGDGKVDHICFSVNNKFLHPNHPIGWVRGIDVWIDGEKIDIDRICFVLRGQWIPLRYMRTIRDIWWKAIEDAWIYIDSDGIEPGSAHDVACTLHISLMVHNENIDWKDDYNCLHCELAEKMIVQEEVRA